MQFAAGRRCRWRGVVGVVVALAALAFVSPAIAGSFRVNSAGAGSTPTPDCAVLNQTGTCTLRDAITLANADPGPNVIGFAIGGGGTQTIALGSSPLPAITTATTINGTTQLGYSSVPLIVLDGTAQTSGYGLDLGGTGDQVLGLNIQHFSGSGAVNLGGGGGHTIAGNYIGVNAAGTAAAPNNMGIQVSSNNNTVGGTTAAARNVISGNQETNNASVSAGGITIPQSRTGNVVAGNYIGTNAAGSAGIPNGNEAVIVLGSSNTIGGTASGAGNVISGAHTLNNGHGDGVGLYGNNNVVQGNLIGTDAMGTVAIPNELRGVNVNGGSNNTIGGTSASARNVISGNGTGVSVGNGQGSGNTVQGNYIGLEPDGATALGNSQGIQIFAGSGNLIGGTASSAGNVISGNGGTGVTINGNASFVSSTNVVQGNLIGTDASGVLARANGQSGILIDGTNNTVGGTAAGAANTIAFNTGVGIVVTKITTAASTGNTISGNSIHDNGDLGIDLSPAGVTANDSGDGDTGANNLQNFPVITNSSLTGNTLAVAGTLDSQANRTYHIEIFQNASCDGSQHGQGATFVTSTDVTTDGGGSGSFSVSTAAVTSGSVITTTATDGPTGDTSEFSQCSSPSGGDPAQSSPYVVNTTDDQSPNGCTVIDCTLREAIEAANTDGAASTINFDIPNGSPPYPIQLGGTGLFASAPVTIDGTTQPGFDTDPIVEVTGVAEDATLDLDLGSDGSTIRGLILNGSDASDLLMFSGNNTVEGNFIGTTVDGLDVQGGGAPAISLMSDDNVIGGDTAAERNVIANDSSSGDAGIVINSGTGNRIEGNYIGTNKTGSAALGGFEGVRLQSNGNTIGGTTAGTRNVISGNSNAGIVVVTGADGNSILGNYIGVGADGSTPLGNGTTGVQVSGANNTVIGGVAAGEANTIAFNGTAGVEVDSDSTGNAIRGNSIHDNNGAPTEGIGIALDDPNVGPFGVVLNDSCDVDAGGGNDTQNFPVLTSATSTGGGDTAVAGSLNSVPNTQYVLDFYASPTPDPSLFGEGQTYLGSTIVTTDGTCNASFTASLATSVPVGDVVAATATDPAGNTSEFSHDVTVSETAQTGPNFTVNTSDDLDDGTCGVDDCTLREAINAANGDGDASIIGFDIPGAGVHTIQPQTLLPDLSTQVTIDGTTQPGTVVNSSSSTDNAQLKIELQGLAAGYSACDCEAAGLVLAVAGSTVHGLVIDGAFDTGIWVRNTSNATISGNFIGTTPDGTADGDNGTMTTGVDLDNATNAVVGGTTAPDRNIISGAACEGECFFGTGVEVRSGGSGSKIQNNFIGTDNAGSAAIANATAIDLSDPASGTTVTGNVISGNGEGITSDAAGLTISTNHIGTNSTGTTALANAGDGMHVNDGANMTITGNTISGNAGDGIDIFGFDSFDNLIQSNKIGTNDAGNGAIPNGGDGIALDESNPNTVNGNLISGNVGAGIDISGHNPDLASNVVTANIVGLNLAGTAAIGNGGDGITVSGADNTIGGATVGARNVIGGNTGHGIQLFAGFFSADSNTVQGNYSGVNAAGTAAVPNGIDGIAVDGGSNNSITGNLASGNTNQGIAIFKVVSSSTANANVVQGNKTGPNAAGTGTVPNGGDGIRVFHATNTTIGGITAGQPNDSVGNGANGIAIIGANSTGNTIRGNRVRDNGLLGIELTAGDSFDGKTPNDTNDPDTGANNLQNFPILTSATVGATSTNIVGSLNSAGGTYTIDYYASTTCDPSGNGEGARWLGYSVFSTGEFGNDISIDTGTGITAPVTVGEAITATATDSNGNTSEFSPCVTATGSLPGMSLTSDEATAPAGAANVPLSSVPGPLLGLYANAPIPNSPIPNSAVGAAPIPNSPIPNSPIPNSPIPNSPIANSPIANSGLTGLLPATLNQIPLSAIPIDWTAIWAGTAKANVPLASLTLADVFADTTAKGRFLALPLQTLRLDGSLLRGIRFSALLFGAITLDKVPPYTQQAWCTFVGKPSTCNDFIVGSTTVLGLDIAGLLGNASLGNVKVGQIRDLTPPNAPIPNSPIPNSPIPNSPIANSPIPNSAIPLTEIGSVVIGSLFNPSAVVDCTKLSSCLTKTLADASRANAIKPTATYQDILRPRNPNDPSTSPLANSNFNEFVIAMIGVENLPWESWPFDGFQGFVNGSVVHYHLGAPVPCNTPYQLRTLLPHGFLVKPGSSALAIAIGAASPVADPATDPDTGATWTLPALNCTGMQTVRLDFQGLPGFRLGRQTASAKLIIGSTVKTALDQAPVTVTQNNEPADDSASTAPAIQANTLAIGHIATSGDVDFRSFSTTGLPRGTEVTVYLRPPTGTDLDVYLTKPSQQTLLSSPIPNSPIPNSPIPNSPLPDLGGTLGGTTDNPQPEGLQDAPIPNSSIASAGISRGDGVEVAQVTLSGDENGPLNIAVAGYNGAHSTDAYTLRVKAVVPPQLPACPARTFANPNVTNVGTLPSTIPSTTQTLFVMNFNAMAKTYGLTATQNLVTKLNQVAALTSVKGAVLQVDGDASVRASKAAWDAAPCSTAAANDVVRKTNAVVARYRAQATGVQNIVIVGGDEIQPMARISDLTTDANESTALGDLIFTTNGLTRANALFASEFLGNTLTDDAYTAGTTIPWFGRELYLPQLAAGRLVETPNDIMAQLQQYIDSGGVLRPSTAVVTGYDFMKDEATAISNELATRTPAVTRDANGVLGNSFIGDNWERGDLVSYFQQQSFSRGIVSANGHYNHWELAPSKTTGSPPATPLPLTSSDLISTGVLPALGSSTPQDVGSILFTMGCHAGLNVSDTFLTTADARLRDWAQALAQNKTAVYVANTGYGYGDTNTIALSERLMTMFANNLVLDGSIGRKLVLAKQQYFATIASYDPYAEKALAEATFYGLPFYRIGDAPDPGNAQLVTTDPDPSAPTLRRIATFPFDPVLTPHAGTNGTFWSAAPNDGIEYLKDRPIEPRFDQEVTTSGGLRAHGVRITELTTADQAVTPEIATPTIDLSAHELEAKVTNVIFPATFASVNHWSAFGVNHDQLVVVPGQTRREDTGGQIQRLVRHIKLQVLYSSSTDITPPIFGTVGSIVTGSTATIFAHTSDAGSGVVSVMAYFTQGGAAWTFVPLTKVPGTTDLYKGTATGITVPKIEAAFWSQDAAGNVAYTTDKGKLFTSLTGDTQGPEVLITQPADTASYILGSTVPAIYACSDDGGVNTCTGTVANGVKIDTTSVGQKTFTVNATDLSGNPVTVTVKYNVIYNFDNGSGGFLSPIQNPPVFNSVKAGSSVPIKFSLGGNQGLNIFDPGPPTSPYSQPMSCNPSIPVDLTAPTNTSGGSMLTYDSKTQTYTYSWKTDPTWAPTGGGTNCRLLTVKFKDGTTHVAFFKITK